MKTARRAHHHTSSSSTHDDLEKQIRASIGTATERLMEELRAGKSEKLVAVLRFASRFHHYSPLNQWAIYCQCPEATRVAGYKTWERMGYHVAKGQHGIRILAPRPYTKENDDGEIEARISFRLVPVFDASQLSPEDVAAKPFPVFFADQGSDEATAALYARMCEAMQASGIRVEERADLPGTVQGRSGGGYVQMRAGLPSRNAVGTLAHEWAHEVLHQGEANKEQKERGNTIRECHAEATAFVVCAHFAIHNTLSSDYLLHWGATPDVLAAELAMVQRAASHIISALEGKDKAAEDDEAAAAA